MKTRFLEFGKDYKVKTITRKAVIAELGEERFKRIMEEAQQTFFEDPGIAIEYMLGGGPRWPSSLLQHEGTSPSLLWRQRSNSENSDIIPG